MTTKLNPHRCQRCHHKHATHSLLGTILLCSTCYADFIGEDAQQPLFITVDAPAYRGPIPIGLYHLD